MIKIGYCALAAIAVCFLLSVSGCPVQKIGGKIADTIGNRIAAEEAAQKEAEFQRRLQADIEAGRIVKRVKPDGRIEYSMPSSPAPAPVDSPTSSK
jgi:hypothetical protein